MKTLLQRFSLVALIALVTACGRADVHSAYDLCNDDLPCEDGYQESTMAKTDGPVPPELQRIAHTKLCTANPMICKTDADCQKTYRCDFHTESFVPQGAGVCMPNPDAVLGS